MRLSLPPRLHPPAGSPAPPLSSCAPSSKVELTQKLSGRIMGGAGGGAIERSSISIAPVVAAAPPETTEICMRAALAGTVNCWLRRVNVEQAISPVQPELWPVAV